ncbi:hypothetical protein D3C87_1864280 [compost metagenome]
MVVSDQQTARRDNLSGTATTEMHNSVFQAGLVNAVYVFRRQTETLSFHRIDIFTDQHRDPHPFISTRTE